LWKIEPGGNVELRISVEGFVKMQETFSNCAAVGNIEEIVQKAEKMTANQRANRTREEWFEEYVRLL